MLIFNWREKRGENFGEQSPAGNVFCAKITVVPLWTWKKDASIMTAVFCLKESQSLCCSENKFSTWINMLACQYTVMLCTVHVFDLDVVIIVCDRKAAQEESFSEPFRTITLYSICDTCQRVYTILWSNESMEMRGWGCIFWIELKTVMFMYLDV